MTDMTRTAVVAADGTARVPIKVANGTSTWDITQVSAELPSAPVGATCFVRKNTYMVTPMIATGDTAADNPPVTLLPSDEMTIEYTGCTPGTVAKLLISYNERN